MPGIFYVWWVAAAGFRTFGIIFGAAKLGLASVKAIAG
jgi:hypothetical protein